MTTLLLRRARRLNLPSSALLLAFTCSADHFVQAQQAAEASEIALSGQEQGSDSSLNQFEHFLLQQPKQRSFTMDELSPQPRALQGAEVTEEEEVDVNALPKSIRDMTVYPDPFFSDDEVKQGAFIFYIFGIMYAFLGISLATQDYINPSIDIIKKKGVLSSESMNATLLAMTNSAAESFIIMNSIFFGVSDIGISTVVQQAAFYSFIVQSVFYLIVPAKTLIDWWIITRETAFILVYLIVISACLYGNKVEIYKALILFLLYIIHIFAMKFSSKYEVAIKQALANNLEIKTLQKIAKEDITRFHMNLKTEAISIEMLNKVHFKLRGEYIVFKDSLIRKKLRLSNSIKSGEEKFADKDDKTLMARKMWKEAVSMIIIKLQAYKHNLQIQRTQQCKQSLHQMLPMLESKELDDDEKIFGESYDSEDESVNSVNNSQIQIVQHSSEESASEASMEKAEKSIGGDGFSQGQGHTPLGQLSKQQRNILSSGDIFAGRAAANAEDEQFNKTYMQYIEHSPAQQLPPSHIYEIIMQTFYSGQSKIKWPENARKRVVYVFLIPLTHLQALSIPNPMRGKGGERENLYPVTIFMSLLWIWLYTYFIVWFTFDLTVAFNWHFNVLPMVLYPFGIALRDYKKKVNLEQAIEAFNDQLKEQQMSLAETFSGPIFQITGLMGLTWTLYIGLKGTDYVSFINESIQFQMPMLVVVVIVKYSILVCLKFRTSKKLFYVNLMCYLIFLIVIVLVDYRIELFGN